MLIGQHVALLPILIGNRATSIFGCFIIKIIKHPKIDDFNMANI